MTVVGTQIYKIDLSHGRSSVIMNHRQSTSLLLLFAKHYSSTTTAATAVASTRKEPSFAESYLVDKCGFSPESALSLSRHLKFKTAKKPDAMLSCLREYGFSESQLLKLVRRRPALLAINTEKILSPKLDFFLSKCVSRTELATVISSHPTVLKRSLEKNIIPFYDFFGSLLKSDEKVLRLIGRCPRLIQSFGYHVKENINHLRDNRVPESKIATVVRNWPATLARNTEKFNECVRFVKEKGLNPLNVSFVIALATVGSMSKQTWENKVLLFESWGWSREDIIEAFSKHPQFMGKSENKINAVMDLLINEVGCESSYIAKHPIFLNYSLEQRIIPRCSVIKVLLSKGMVKLTCLSSMLIITDDMFEKKLLTSYGEEAPNLLKLYREKKNVPK